MAKHRVLAGLIIVAIALSMFAAGCNNKTTTTKTKTDNKPAPEKVTVEIKNFAFQPETVTIGVRGRVTWINKDDGQHTVVGKDFDSGTLGLDESFSYEFINPGTYAYKCALHPYMEGKVVVK
jgi:plastocyanin